METVAVVLNKSTDDYEYYVPKIFKNNEEYTAVELAEVWVAWQKEYIPSDLEIVEMEVDDQYYRDPKYYNYNIYTDEDDYRVRQTNPFETDDKKPSKFYFNLTWNDFVESFMLEDLVHISVEDESDIAAIIESDLLRLACEGIYTTIKAYCDDYIEANGGIEVFEDATKQHELTTGITQETIKYLTETFHDETGEDAPIDTTGSSTKVNFLITNFD